MQTIAPGAAQQKDNLCGPFWAARMLRDFGFDTWAGAPIDEDLVALHAGTTLPAPSRSPSVLAGAASRTSYRYALPTAPSEESGTSPAGLARVIASASGGALGCIAIRGAWTADRVVRLVDAAPAAGARLLANLRTGRLWASRPPVEALIAELRGVEVDGPPAEWDVGHFVELAMVLRGPAGSVVLVRDSYPILGWEGHHLQPPRALAAALLRGDGREGGVLAVVPHEKEDELTGRVRSLGLELGLWNNGSRSEGNGGR